MKIKEIAGRINVPELGKKYWPFIAIVFIIFLATYARTVNYNYPYLRNVDSYNFVYEMQQIVDHGHILPYTNLSLAPNGSPRSAGMDLYPYSMAYSFGLLRLFVPNYSMFEFLVWAPALMIALAAIPIYFIGKMLYDRRTGVMAAFFVVFNLAVVSRTMGADPGRNSAVLLFSFIAIALFLYAYKYVNKNGFSPRGIMLTVIAGIGLATWGYTWTGFWYVVWLLAGFIFLKTVIRMAHSRNIVRGIKAEKRAIMTFIAVMIIFFALTVPVLGTGMITNTLSGPFSFSGIKSEGESAFPNVYVSVAELQSGGGVATVIQSSNVILFLFMIFSLVYLLYLAYKKRDAAHIDTFLLLLIWFAGPVYASLIGVRFEILFAAPVALGAAIFISKAFKVLDGEDD
jgi:asparagine N-glycosylation enzyme membrane subunit Stt3